MLGSARPVYPLHEPRNGPAAHLRAVLVLRHAHLLERLVLWREVQPALSGERVVGSTQLDRAVASGRPPRGALRPQPFSDKPYHCAADEEEEDGEVGIEEGVGAGGGQEEASAASRASAISSACTACVRPKHQNSGNREICIYS